MSDESRSLPLVTGATGFAGSHLVDRLLQSHDRVIAWSHRSGRPAEAGDSRIRWQSVDVLDRVAIEQALDASRPQVIYHLAGLPHVAESWNDAGRALKVNVLGTYHLLESVRTVVPAAMVILAGSALVYKPSSDALSEDAPLGPADPYGVSKLAQEMLAERASTSVIRTRPFNHAGPGQSDAFVTSSFARQIAEIESGGREPVLRVGNLDARRDILDVRDTARAYERLADGGQPGRVYNICAGTAHRVGDLLERLLSQARVRVSVQQDPSRLRPSDNPVVLGDPARIASETGWRPEISIDTTLADLLAWWRTQLAEAR